MGWNWLTKRSARSAALHRQVKDAEIALVVSGPLVPRGVSDLLLHG